jgi:hypothetical protein
MAPELTELGVDAGASLQPEFEDPVLPGRSIGGLDQSRPERRRHWPLEIVLRKFERLVEAQHPRFFRPCTIVARTCDSEELLRRACTPM